MREGRGEREEGRGKREIAVEESAVDKRRRRRGDSRDERQRSQQPRFPADTHVWKIAKEMRWVKSSASRNDW